MTTINEQLRRINAAKTRLMLNNPFYGYLLLYLETKPSKLAFGTMATDGYNLYYDPDGAINSWTTDELVGAIAHEISHCALGHSWRCESRDRKIWNFATDYAINNILSEEGFSLPKDVLMDTKYKGQSAEFIYMQLQKERQEVLDGLKSMDDETLWGKFMQTDGKPDDDGKGGDNGGGENGNDKTAPFTFNPLEVRDNKWWEEKLGSAITFARQQGKVPAGFEGLIDSLLSPKLSWRELLRDYVTSSYANDYKMFPSNKKFMWMPLYMPRTKSNHLNVTVAMDTSGSISDETAKQFITEIREIANSFDSYNIHYMQCDAQVDFYRELVKEDEDDWPMHIVGRGGTSFVPVFNKVEELGIDVPLLIYLTDMMGTFPNEAPPYNTLWVSTMENYKGPFGDTIYIDA